VINPELLEILRWPAQPEPGPASSFTATISSASAAGLRFPRSADGFPILVVEEAELPRGCESLADLPCQRGGEKRRGAASIRPRRVVIHQK